MVYGLLLLSLSCFFFSLLPCEEKRRDFRLFRVNIIVLCVTYVSISNTGLCFTTTCYFTGKGLWNTLLYIYLWNFLLSST